MIHAPPYNASNTSRNVSRWSPQIIVRPIKNVPTAVKDFIDSTKRLQDSLRLWSSRQMSDTDVSDIYVHVGTEYNALVQAFAYHSIDLSETYSFPEDLRSVLEICLGEDPSPQTHARYLPQVRQIIYDFLQVLRAKQPIYWQAIGRQQPYMPPPQY